MKVLAAMSGGVDSAVAAGRAVDAGHDVTGVHLALSKNPQTYRSGARGCCSIEDAHDARRAADVLGIPFYVWDLSDRFGADVVDDFVAEYAAGRTPNPCVRCNEKIKFSAVLERGVALGFDAVCTGHYARLLRAGNEVELHRAVDLAKDQSYVLGVLNADQLRRSYFPLGSSYKADVRAKPSSAAWPWQASRTVTTFASSPMETPQASWSGNSAAGRATSLTSPVPRLASMPGPIASQSGSGGALDSAHLPPMASVDSYLPSHLPPTRSPSVLVRHSGSRSSMPSDRPGLALGSRQHGRVRCRFEPMASQWRRRFRSRMIILRCCSTLRSPVSRLVRH